MTERATPAALRALLAQLEQAAETVKFRKLFGYSPFKKQAQFHALGATKKLRALFAGNQDGKTYSGAAEVAMHLTGEYPSWWQGRRWTRPVTGWVAGEGGLLTRDGPQKLLFGEPGLDEAIGTGLVPREAIKQRTLSRGVANAYDTVFVKHKTNGVEDGTSIVGFKSYDQGRTKFQTKTLDFFWGDEEPDEDISSELLARISSTDGMGFYTFTPLKGRSKLVKQFLEEPSNERAYVVMTIHEGIKSLLSPEERQKIIEGYPAHQRDARAFGVPSAGEGAVFRVRPEALLEPHIPMHMIPLEWTKIWGIDFGINHPFAAVLLLWDRDLDVMHVWHTLRISDQTPTFHVPAMMAIGADVPVAWPKDGHSREKSSGEELQLAYKRAGLKMIGTHAQFDQGGVSLEAGVMEMEERMKSGRWKVSEHLTEFQTEMRNYHRENGLIVPIEDDLLSAARYAMMMKKYAKAVPLGSKRTDMRGRSSSSSSDWDIFTGEATHG